MHLVDAVVLASEFLIGGHDVRCENTFEVSEILCSWLLICQVAASLLTWNHHNRQEKLCSEELRLIGKATCFQPLSHFTNYSDNSISISQFSQCFVFISQGKFAGDVLRDSRRF